MKVQAGRTYYYHPNLLDRCDARTNLKSGDAVRVVNLYGAPKANTMEHCHVESLQGEFIGLVHCNSLHTKAEYVAYLRREIAKREAYAVTANLVTTRLSDYAEVLGLRK